MKKILIFINCVAIAIAFTFAASAAYDIAPAGFQTNQSIDFFYNISISNTDANQSAITQVNITLPANFAFSSVGTDAAYANFSNTSTILSWSNFSGYLINSSQTKSFWFNANSTSPGNYSLAIAALNAGGIILNYINVTIINSTIINDTVSCTQDWDCTGWSACLNSVRTRTCTDLNDCGSTAEKPAESQSCAVFCNSNWTCTNWSECIGSAQIRVCVDSNTCGNATGKPEETQTCADEAACTQSWRCAEWQPEICFADKNQTRTCTDANSCANETGKPEETQTCEIDEPFFSKYFGLIAGIIILMIFAIIVLIIRAKQQMSEEQEIEQLASEN